MKYTFANFLLHASAIAQGAIIASCGKSLNSALRRNQIQSHISNKTDMIHYVDVLN